MTSKDRKIAEGLAEKLREAASHSVKRIILYGSRATGKATAESEYDFLVVEADPIGTRDERRSLHRAVSGLEVPVDVWVMGEEELEETKNIIGGLAYPANKHGAVLYENA